MSTAASTPWLMAPAALWLVIPAIVFLAAVVVGRWMLVDETAIDRLLNRTLSWQLIGVTIEEAGVRTSFADLTYRIFLGFGVLSLAGLVGLATLLALADPDRALRRQRTFDLIAVCAAVVVMLIGRPADPTLPGFGWQTLVYWTIFNVPTVPAAALIMWASLRELRQRGATIRERTTFTVLLVVSILWVANSIADLVRVLDGQPSGSPGERWTAGSVLMSLAVSALVAVPMVKVLLIRAGYDRTGRMVRRLHPLWLDLTTVVPDVVLDVEPGDRSAESRLYRITVEIRDVLQHLKLYLPAGRPLEGSARRYAHQMAEAIRAKEQGASPRARTDEEHYWSGAQDMAAELEQLLALARAWPGSDR